ncbi:protein phosphatase 2C domain-containing protein [Bacillus suaedaesalsae]|uniref:Protein phosphatase 2C domain-containing protein n=1 Tax=Bacillus suaedaesalsae TaxID=2810349 RepID=A0ABS2DHJ7_9BACI|nr:protein phosphatase 2C domain-containing protein [Bacillus suaedaesalsae]MBM6617959.1 protein phosphatase 2C domain-containing protein [Bacillus suaedaesalsae]
MSKKFRWVGSEQHYVDQLDVTNLEHITIGRFGGNSSAGQYKNEDGCLVWVDDANNCEFVVLMDAHNTAESAELVMETIEGLEAIIKSSFTLPSKECFNQLSKVILSTFQSTEFSVRCKTIQGETACLLVARNDKYLWWLSIGDCILHLHHPELAKLNEYGQNHRSFYEWIGFVNTFDLEVPCYSEGRKELRKGENHIFLTTDGLTECPNTSFENPSEIFMRFEDHSVSEGTLQILNEIKEKNVRDSTTIISWKVEVIEEATLPSDLK